MTLPERLENIANGLCAADKAFAAATIREAASTIEALTKPVASEDAQAIVEWLNNTAKCGCGCSRRSGETAALLSRLARERDEAVKDRRRHFNAAADLNENLKAALERVRTLEEALEMIAGKRQCIDNLMSDKDIARAALSPAPEPPKGEPTANDPTLHELHDVWKGERS